MLPSALAPAAQPTTETVDSTPAPSSSGGADGLASLLGTLMGNIPAVLPTSASGSATTPDNVDPSTTSYKKSVDWKSLFVQVVKMERRYGNTKDLQAMEQRHRQLAQAWFGGIPDWMKGLFGEFVGGAINATMSEAIQAATTTAAAAQAHSEAAASTGQTGLDGAVVGSTEPAVTPTVKGTKHHKSKKHKHKKQTKKAKASTTPKLTTSAGYFDIPLNVRLNEDHDQVEPDVDLVMRGDQHHSVTLDSGSVVAWLKSKRYDGKGAFDTGQRFDLEYGE